MVLTRLFDLSFHGMFTHRLEAKRLYSCIRRQTLGLSFALSISVIAIGCRDPDGTAAEAPTKDTKSPSVNAPIDESEFKTTATPRKSKADDWFRDVTASSGVSFQHSSGRESNQFTMVETFGAGVGLFDYDRDGDIDLLCVSGGTISKQLEMVGIPCRLYRNDGDFHFVDVTEGSGLNVEMDYSHGIAVGDVNRDGFPDIFITTYGRSRLFMNVDGQGFRDATEESQLDVQGWHTAACFADVTADGILDLYVAGYIQWQPDANELCLDPSSELRDVCMPGNFPGTPDRLFVGKGDGTFIDQTDKAGLLPDGKGLGIVAADFDQNGHLDFYIANDVVRNHLYMNQGKGTFHETAIISGVSGNEYGAPEGSMGVDVGDFNHDGNPDIVVTNYEFEENDLYRNEGNGLFSHVTVPLGLAGGCKQYVGFGTVFLDADMDGWSDLIVINGHVTYRNRKAPYQQPSFLFRNEQGQRFKDITESAGPWFSSPHSGRGVAVGDLNNDGAPDLVISEQDGPTSILQNLKSPENWIGIEPIGTVSGTDAVGTVVRLDGTSNNASQTVKGGGSYLSYSDRRLLFPITDKTAFETDVIIRWPNQTVEQFKKLTNKSYHVLTEGTGKKLSKNKLLQD